MRTEDEHRTLIERYIAAYNAFDVAGMIALLDADVVFENIAGGQVTAQAHGRDEYRLLAERAAILFTSRRQTVQGYRSTGDGAEVEIAYHGVLAADLGPSLRAGETLQLTGRSVFQIRDGRIVRIVDES